MSNFLKICVKSAEFTYYNDAPKIFFIRRVSRQVPYNLLLLPIHDIAHWPRLDWKWAEGTAPFLYGCATLRLFMD